MGGQCGVDPAPLRGISPRVYTVSGFDLPNPALHTLGTPRRACKKREARLTQILTCGRGEAKVRGSLANSKKSHVDGPGSHEIATPGLSVRAGPGLDRPPPPHPFPPVKKEQKGGGAGPQSLPPCQLDRRPTTMACGHPGVPRFPRRGTSDHCLFAFPPPRTMTI